MISNKLNCLYRYIYLCIYISIYIYIYMVVIKITSKVALLIAKEDYLNVLDQTYKQNVMVFTHAIHID